MKQSEFKVGDIISNGTVNYLILELYNGRPWKVQDTQYNAVFTDEHLRWNHINWKIVKPKKTRVFK